MTFEGAALIVVCARAGTADTARHAADNRKRLILMAVASRFMPFIDPEGGNEARTSSATIGGL